MQEMSEQMGVGNFTRPLPERVDWQRTAGFTLHTDVNDKMLHELSLASVDPVNNTDGRSHLGYDKNWETIDPSMSALYLVMKKQVSAFKGTGHKASFREQYGVTAKDDLRSDPHTIEGGFADLDFPWHFSAGLASACVNEFVEQKVIDQEQRSQLTLHDWANVIGSGWFSRLTHELALTDGFVYATYGNAIADYKPGEFAGLLARRTSFSEDEKVFDYEAQLEPEEGLTYATLSLSKAAILALRKRLARRSAGCPVARYSVRLSNELVADDSHTQSLLKGDQLQVIPERSNDLFTRAIQQYSAIDKTLALFALQLDSYQDKYGMPVATPGAEDGDVLVDHQQRQPIDVLRWPAAHME